MTERFSFPDLFRKPVDIDKDTSVIIGRIVIPKIQRPYAQGRTDGVSTFVRNTFLDDIFFHLISSEEIMDLNFVYGVIRRDEKDYYMELLDGQQRLTTLFLLYWYISNVELEKDSEEDVKIRSLLERFSYETRSSSAYFCRKLANYHVSLSGTTPQKAITSATKWYFKSFGRDSTICAMLTMLDAIDKKYKSSERNDLYHKLDNIRFYVKSLGYYHLSEELYIKMNARGLQLSAFENFKADLTNYVAKSDFKPFSELVSLYKKGDYGIIPFYQNFSIKLDAKWVDLFWKRGSEDFDSSYMSFFSRYFAYKYIVLSDGVVSDRDMRQDVGIKELYSDAESRIQRNEYFGFKPFQNLLNIDSKIILSIDKALDILYDYDLKDEQMQISRTFTPAWERNDSGPVDDFLYNSNTRFTQNKLILLAAVMEFIEAQKVFDIQVFKEWMRVVSNIVENTNIDSLTPVASLIRKFSAVIRFISSKGLLNSVESFYRGLSQWPKVKDENRALEEEVEKARRISESPEWLLSFTYAETHPFFKGMVLFFYKNEMTLNQFSRGYERVSSLFDENGITPELRVNHILLRAIISKFMSWGELDRQYITERSETNKYLKNILASHPGVRAMFADIALLEEGTNLIDYLNNVIDNAGEVSAWPNASPEQLSGFNLAIENLRHNIRLYDYFTSIDESQKSCFRIYWFEGHIMLAIYNSTNSRIALDTNRVDIVKRLNTVNGFQFHDNNQSIVIDNYGLCFGKEIWLSKEINNTIFWIGFCTDHTVRIQLQFSSEDEAREHLVDYPGSSQIVDSEHFLALPSLSEYPNLSIHEQLSSIIADVEEKLYSYSSEQ